MVYAQSESVLKNETHRILLDFDIQTDHPIPARRPHFVIVIKKVIQPTSWLCRPGGPLSKNQRKRKERKVLGPSQRTERDVEHEGDGDTNYY